MPDPAARRFSSAELSRLIPRPPLDVNKYSRGTVGVVGGSASYPGAPILSALASARSGAGYTRLVTVKSVAACARTHLLSIPVDACAESAGGSFCNDSLSQAQAALKKSKALLVGPGMGASEEAAKFLGAFLASPDFSECPIVLDADALNLIAQDHELLLNGTSTCRVLTPHDGEAARLLGRRIVDRYEDICILADMFKSTILLKGPDTLIATPEGELSIVDEGGPELAKAGSGDVLGGIITAFLSQGLEPGDAATLGAFVHARAGKIAAAKLSVHAVMPEDIINAIGPALLSMEA